MAAVPALAQEDPFAAAQAQFAAVVASLRSQEARALTHSDLEREIEAQGHELLRLLYQGHLDARGPGAAAGPVCGADGVARGPARLPPRAPATGFGPGAGRRRPPHPAPPVPKRQVEALVARAAQDFDTFYAGREAPAAAGGPTGAVLVLTVDGKGGVMRPADLREPTRTAAAQRTHKLATRLSKGEKRHAKRMATVAAVYTIAPCVRTPEQGARRLAPARAAGAAR